VTHIEVRRWPKAFPIGDMHRIVSLIDGFSGEAPQNKYVLSNELGDGRGLIAAPSLLKQANGYGLLCPVAPGARRVDRRR
jgi:hypothetical protein